MTARSSRVQPPPRLERLALAIAAGCVVALTSYAALRVIQAIAFPEPNPAIVIWSERAGYFWRLWIAAYIGGMAAIGAWALGGSAAGADRIAGALPKAIGVAALAIAAQGTLVP